MREDSFLMVGRQREALFQVNCLPESHKGLMIEPGLEARSPESSAITSQKEFQVLSVLQLRCSNALVPLTRQGGALLSNTNQNTSQHRLISSV